MRKALVVMAVSSLMASMAFAVPTRVDYNGELTSTYTTAGYNSANAAPFGVMPAGWNPYQEGSGGGLGSAYDVGGSANARCFRYEVEAPALGGTGVYPGGHSVIIGGSGGAGRHGISQTITSTEGKHYWMVGSAKGSTTANVYHQWGLSNGSSPVAGIETNGSVFGGSGTLGKQNYTHGLVATGNQVTAMFGARSVNTGGGVNIYTDGIRVLESDVQVYSTLQNAGFDGANWNVTQWYGNNSGEAANVTDLYMFDGWLPLGGQSGQVSKIRPVVDETGWGNAMELDVYKGGGRQFFFQRINDGLPVHDWTFTTRVKTSNYGNADNRVGIDPTGGTDPASPNVIWSNTNTANAVYQDLIVNATGRGSNGITLFLANGWDFTRGNRIAGGTATGADQSTISWFDSMTLVPEPTTVLFLAIGGLVCLRRR